MEVSEEVRKHYSNIGKKGGETNKKKGSAYFKWVRSQGTKKRELLEENEKEGIKPIKTI
jgi:hypothetical protein